MHHTCSFFVLVAALLTSAASFAADPALQSVPTCTAKTRELPVMNEQVLQWKQSTANEYKDRAHVSGVVVKEYPDATGHGHVQIRIGPNPTDTLEVIYNEDFGALPGVIPPGTTVEACGDYITSNAPYDHYPVSPDGALIHWLHRSPRPQQHDSGYLILGGVVYGQAADRKAETQSQPTNGSN